MLTHPPSAVSGAALEYTKSFVTFAGLWARAAKEAQSTSGLKH
jgi:hypothetical protein